MGFSSVSVSDCETVESQTLSFSRKRDASVSLECEQCKKTKPGLGPAPFQSVPKSERQRRQCLSFSRTEFHRRQKERLGSTKRNGLTRRKTQCPRWEKHCLEDYRTGGSEDPVEVELEAHLPCPSDVTGLVNSW